MPVLKVQKVHNFGIIPYSHYMNLEKRIKKQNIESQRKETLKAIKLSRFPFDDSDTFVQSYNCSRTVEEHEKLECKGKILLENLKRKVNQICRDKILSPTLPSVWMDLINFAQCKGALQEDSLTLLFNSLSQTPFSVWNVDALFFLSETLLFWLQTDIVNQLYLRVAEIKIIKILYLVTIRLYYHHMVGNLQDKNNYRLRLQPYIDNLINYLHVYEVYPTIHLKLLFVKKAGNIILYDVPIIKTPRVEKGLNNDTDANLDKHDDASHIRHETLAGDRVKNIPESSDNQHSNDTRLVQRSKPCPRTKLPEQFKPVHENCNRKELRKFLNKSYKSFSQDLKNSESGADGENMKNTGEIGDAAKCLKIERADDNETTAATSHVESTNRCTAVSPTKTSEAGTTLSSCVHNLSPSLWHALDIWRCSVVRGDFNKALLGLQNCGIGNSSENWVDTVISLHIAADAAVCDIRIMRELQEIACKMMPVSIKFHQLQHSSPRYSARCRLNRDILNKEAVVLPNEGGSSLKNETFPKQNIDQTSQPSRLPDANYLGDVTPTCPLKQISAKETDSSNKKLPWPWELSVLYIELLADICTRTSDSKIRKLAVLGNHPDVSDGLTQVRSSQQRRSCGLIDLIFAHTREKVDDLWHVRYSAMEYLATLFEFLQGRPMSDGVCNTIWTILESARASETDKRVLESVKVGHICQSSGSTVIVGKRLASNLANVYLPALPPIIKVPAPSKQKPKPLQCTYKPTIIPHRGRLSLRQEMDVTAALYEKVPDYFTRTSYDLHRIVEDQWRKELHEKTDYYNEERLTALHLEQENVEELERHKDLVKAAKFNSSITHMCV